MNTFKLLVVEDDDRDLAVCERSLRNYADEKQIELEIISCESVEEAFSNLDNSFDGAIIDLRLGNKDGEGNRVVQRIRENLFRIPTAILTGTPSFIDDDFNYIGKFIKGEPGSEYDNIMDRLWSVRETGVTRILGGTGEIEKRLNAVFEQNIIPNIEKWEQYARLDPERTERSLLRHILNHLVQWIDVDTESYHPEEFYLYPPVTDRVQTGSIVRCKENKSQWFVVMSPDCDLVERESGGRNTDIILVVEVLSPDRLFDWYNRANLSSIGRDKRTTLDRYLRNNGRIYYHCLPETDFFPLGFMNFRKVIAIPEDQLEDRFRLPHELQISPPFVKDIVARFSSYYARQGQPDVDFSELFESC